MRKPIKKPLELAPTTIRTLTNEQLPVATGGSVYGYQIVQQTKENGFCWNVAGYHL